MFKLDQSRPRRSRPPQPASRRRVDGHRRPSLRARVEDRARHRHRVQWRRPRRPSGRASTKTSATATPSRSSCCGPDDGTGNSRTTTRSSSSMVSCAHRLVSTGRGRMVRGTQCAPRRTQESTRSTTTATSSGPPPPILETDLVATYAGKTVPLTCDPALTTTSRSRRSPSPDPVRPGVRRGSRRRARGACRRTSRAPGGRRAPLTDAHEQRLAAAAASRHPVAHLELITSTVPN